MNTDLTATAAIRQRAEVVVIRLKSMREDWIAGKPFPYSLDGDDILWAADRIEALGRALVMARKALTIPLEFEGGELGSYCLWCSGADPDDSGPRDTYIGHAPDCKRQQALTEIAGVTGAEPCKHERWSVRVEKNLSGWFVPNADQAYGGVMGAVNRQSVVCASCGITP